MATRIEKREISSRLKGYASLLLGISFTLLASSAFAADNSEDYGTPIVSEPGAPTPAGEDLTYDKALQALMDTQRHSQEAEKWGKVRTVPVAPGADPKRVIEEGMIKVPGVLGVGESTTVDPSKVQPIRVEGSLSDARKVGLDGNPIPQDSSDKADGGWDWVGSKGQEQTQPTQTVQQSQPVQQEAYAPVPAARPAAQPKKTTSFTTVFDAATGVTPAKVRPAAQQNALAAEESAPSPGVSEEEPAQESAAAPEATEEEGPPKTAAQVAKEAVAIYNSAVKLHLAGKLDEAINEYRSALAANPELSQAHCNLGLIFNQQHDYTKAITEFRKALAIDPKDAITYNGIGAALRAQKDMEGAIKNWSTAVTIDPKLATAHYNLGTVYEIQKDFDKATEAYSEAIKNDFRLGEAHYRLGLILMKKNRVEDAKEQFSKALQVSKNAEYCADARKRLAALEMPPATR